MRSSLWPHTKIGLLAAAIGIASVLLAQITSAGTLDEVRARSKLICGVSEGLLGFSEKDKTGYWHGFDVDFCKAVAPPCSAMLARSPTGRSRRTTASPC
jgi:ABC-type amino acid transport substrate-binding protein